jgi:hypothetical protein
MDEITKESRLKAIEAWRDVLSTYSHDSCLVDSEILTLRVKMKMLETQRQLLSVKSAVARMRLQDMGVKLPEMGE